MTIQTPSAPEIIYPDSDGQPMSDNTLQFRWIVTIQGNLDGMYLDRQEVFVAGDLLWYPVQGHPEIRSAPDALVVFGRPKGYRGSYMQWREDNIAPQVTFEIRSPNNTEEELDRKLAFYDRYGVEEYYLYDPEDVTLAAWVRRDGRLQPLPQTHNWDSPRLGIRFDMSGEELVIYQPDGQRFLTFVELMDQKKRAQQLADRAQQTAEQERREREQAQQVAEEERRQREQAQQAAEQERRLREQAQQLAEQQRQELQEARLRAERLAERLRALGIDPET
jgi:Uma2 family endonuclease